MRLAILAVLLLVACLCRAGDEGIVMQMTKSGFEYIGTDAAKQVAGESIPVPAVENKEFSCEGKCYGSFSDGVIQDIHCSAMDFTLGNNVISAAVSGCSVSVNQGKWHLHRSTFPPVSCSGDVTVSLTGLSVDVSVSIVDKAGHLGISATSASVHLGGDNFDFSHGDCDWLLHLVDGEIRSVVLQTVNDQLNSELPKLINNALASYSIPNYVRLPQYQLGINLTVGSLPPPAIVAGRSMQVGVLGLFQIFSAHRPFQQSPPTLPTLPVPNNMAAFTISEYSLNSIAYEAMYNGTLSFAYNTSFLGAPISAITDALSAPTVSIFGNGTMIANLSMATRVSIDNESWFEATMDVSLGVDPSFKGTKLYVAIAPNSAELKLLNVSVLNSNLGPVDTSEVNLLLDDMLNEIVVPLANQRFASGFPIPIVSGLEITDGDITYLPGFVTFDANIDIIKVPLASHSA